MENRISGEPGMLFELHHYFLTAPQETEIRGRNWRLLAPMTLPGFHDGFRQLIVRGSGLLAFAQA